MSGLRAMFRGWRMHWWAWYASRFSTQPVSHLRLTRERRELFISQERSQ